MSPRKSSTSSAEDTRSLRPRYLGIEVAGEPSFSTRWLEGLLAERLRARSAPGTSPGIRVVRREGMRLVIEVEHRVAPTARLAWNETVALPQGAQVGLRTRRTWGTLRKAKQWLRAPPRRDGSGGA